MSRKIINIVVILFLAWSCSDEPVRTMFFDLNTENGVFISCEGNFMYGNASLSFYNSENNTVQNQLFYARNNVPLGDVSQSLTLYENTLFIVVNNSGKIFAIDSETAEFKGVITGFTSPRYMHFISDKKAYVSDLYAHKISIVNPKTFEISGEIELSENHTSEQMVQLGKYVFVYGILVVIIGQFSWGFLRPLVTDYLNSFISSHQRATVLSLEGFSRSIMMIILSPILGYVTDLFSFQTTLIIEGVITLVLGIPFVIKIVKSKV